MFLSKKKTAVTSSQIPNDLANLINEIDIAAAPFDESVIKDKESPQEEPSLVILDAAQEQEPSTVPSTENNEEVPVSLEIDQRHSPDLSMQVSELSFSGELAFMEESIENQMPITEFEVKETAGTEIDPPLEDYPHDKLMQDAWKAPSRPGQEGRGGIVKDLLDGSNGDGINERNGEQSDETTDVFNPFVNIGKRLSDSQDVPQVENVPSDLQPHASASDSVLKRVGVTLVLWSLRVSIYSWMLLWSSVVHIVAFFCRRRAMSFVLFACAVAAFVFHSIDLQDEDITTAPNMTTPVQQDESIAFEEQAGFAWNSSSLPNILRLPMAESFTAKIGQDTSSLDCMIQEMATMFQVFVGVFLTTSLAGWSLVRIRSSGESIVKKEGVRNTNEKLTVKELKRELRLRDLYTTGVHIHLVDRLVDHDNGVDTLSNKFTMGVNVSIVKENVTIRSLTEKLRSRGLPRTGLKDDLITKVWIPARIEELQQCKRDELRLMLKRNKLSPSGLKAALICRLIEAGH